MTSCLIIDDLYPNIKSLLEAIEVQADYRPDITALEILDIIADYEGLILRSKIKLDKSFLEKGKKLKFIARAGAGLDTIDENFLKEKNIILINAPEGNRDAVAEHAVGMLLALVNNFQKGDKEVRNKIWLREDNRGMEIGGKTVGIIGYGNMGKAFAKRLQGFGCKVIFYDKDAKALGDNFATSVEMQSIFENVDILSFHIPLTPENIHLADDAYFKNFKKKIHLINTARGEITTFKTIRKAIESGKIKAAALDVLENEKLKTLTAQQESHFNWLAKSEKVIFSPHIAGWTFESHKRLNEVIVLKIKDALS